MFGSRQVAVYGSIIERGIMLIAEDTLRPTSHARTDIGEGIRFFHLEIAAGRRGGAAHGLYYQQRILPSGVAGVVILRVLHERMEPRRRVILKTLE